MYCSNLHKNIKPSDLRSQSQDGDKVVVVVDTPYCFLAPVLCDIPQEETDALQKVRLPTCCLHPCCNFVSSSMLLCILWNSLGVSSKEWQRCTDPFHGNGRVLAAVAERFVTIRVIN